MPYHGSGFTFCGRLVLISLVNMRRREGFSLYLGCVCFHCFDDTILTAQDRIVTVLICFSPTADDVELVFRYLLSMAISFENCLL